MLCANVLKLLFLKLDEAVHLTALAVQALGRSLLGLSLVGSSQAFSHSHRHRLSNLHSNSFQVYRAINLLNSNPHPSLCNHTNNKVVCHRWEFKITVTENLYFLVQVTVEIKFFVCDSLCCVKGNHWCLCIVFCHCPRFVPKR